jgi:hypothetical protein
MGKRLPRLYWLTDVVADDRMPTRSFMKSDLAVTLLNWKCFCCLRGPETFLASLSMGDLKHLCRSEPSKPGVVRDRLATRSRRCGFCRGGRS